MMNFLVPRLANASILARSPVFAEKTSLRRSVSKPSFSMNKLKSFLLCGALAIAGLAQAGSLTVTASGVSASLSLHGNGVEDAFVFNPTISSNTTNYNIRTAAIAAGWNQNLALKASVTIAPGVIVGSTSTSTAAFDTGNSYPPGSLLALSIGSGAYIVGAGGVGGAGAPAGGNAPGYAGGAGGPAIIAAYPLSIANSGVVAGGGGGGGGGAQTISCNESCSYYGGYGGGGGAGRNAGAGGATGSGMAFGAGANGSLSGGGAGFKGPSTDPGWGGNGGSLGQPGNSGTSGISSARSSGGSGGAAGAALVGKSFVNNGSGVSGTVYGAQQ